MRNIRKFGILLLFTKKPIDYSAILIVQVFCEAVTRGMDLKELVENFGKGGGGGGGGAAAAGGDAGAAGMK